MDKVPRGVNFVAVDTSMGMDVNLAKTALAGGADASEKLGAMYQFRDQFVWGGYAYSGMVYAKIKKGDFSYVGVGVSEGDTRRQPDITNVFNTNGTSSYERTRTMINSLQQDVCYANKYHNSCEEWMLVGGNAATAGRSCIKPDPTGLGCPDDMEFIQDMLRGTLSHSISGFYIPKLTGSSLVAGPGSGLTPPGGILPPPSAAAINPATGLVYYRHAETATVCSVNAIEFYPDKPLRGLVANAPSFTPLPGADPFGTLYANGCPCPPDNDCDTHPTGALAMASCPILNPYYELAHELQGFYYNYPRFPGGVVNPGELKNSFCDFWELGYRKLDDKRNACLYAPDDFLTDPRKGSGSGNAFQCDHSSSAMQNDFCDPAKSPFATTCICDPDMAGCASVGVSAPVPCGVGAPGGFHPAPLARQYVAVCHANRASDGGLAPQEALNASPLSAESATIDPSRCRPTFINYVTDARGDSAVVWPDAGGSPVSDENRLLFRSNGYLGNVAGQGTPESDVWDTNGGGNGDNMKWKLRASAVAFTSWNSSPYYAPQPLDISSNSQYRIRNKLAKDLQRSIAGVYVGGAPGLSRLQDRAATLVVEAPGTMDTTASPSSNGVCEKGEHVSRPADCHLGYYGRPARVELYELDAAGNMSKVHDASGHNFETDSNTITAGTPQCLRYASMTTAACTAPDVRGQLGIPSGYTPAVTKWYGATGPNSGDNIVQSIGANKLDRDGDGVADTHDAVTWGRHLGGEGTKPVIVEAPSSDFLGKDTGKFAEWRRLATATTFENIANRDRMIYALSDGYLHGYVSGIYNTSAASFAGLQVKFGYDDTDLSVVGRERFRYFPNFVTDAANDTGVMEDGRAVWEWNDLVPGRVIQGGEIVVRDVEFPGVAAANWKQKFATVLVFSQGRSGRGYAALDVSEPNKMTDNTKRSTDRGLWEFTLPGGRATSRPNMFHFPGVSGAVNPRVVIVGGDGSGGYKMYSIAVKDGTNPAGFSVALTGSAGEKFEGEVSCLDAYGFGRVTHCYTLGSLGTVVRTEIQRTGANAGRFNSATIVEPAPGGGLVFSSSLVAYFGADNAVNLVFGSGDASPNALQRRGTTMNKIFKVVDPISRLGKTTTDAQVSTTNVCNKNNDASLDAGVINVPDLSGNAGPAIITTPVVSKGVVAFSVYVPPTNACGAGDTLLMAFDYETCRDAFTPANAAPAPVDPTAGVSGGLPASPVFLRRAEAVVSLSSERPQTAAKRSINAAASRGGQNREVLIPVFSRDNQPNF